MRNSILCAFVLFTIGTTAIGIGAALIVKNTNNNHDNGILVVLIIIGVILMIFGKMFVISSIDCLRFNYVADEDFAHQPAIRVRHIRQIDTRIHPITTPEIEIVIDNTSKNKECVICLDVSNSGSLCKLKECDCAQSYYHESCLKKWVEQQASCPLCRKTIIQKINN